MASRRRPSPRSSETSPIGVEINRAWTAMYVRLSARSVRRTRELEPGLLADYDARGRVVGLEILGLEKERVGGALARVSARLKGAPPGLARLADLVA
jgi:hypothetical protein